MKNDQGMPPHQGSCSLTILRASPLLVSVPQFTDCLVCEQKTFTNYSYFGFTSIFPELLTTTLKISSLQKA